LDILIVAVICLSGYHTVVINKEEIFTKRFDFFPQSIELISHHRDHEDAITNVFEFLIYAMEHEKVNDEIREIFKSAIVISKNHSHFKKTNVWHKILNEFSKC
jgi:hypothetical protein